jgi:hypothetical protein
MVEFKSQHVIQADRETSEGWARTIEQLETKKAASSVEKPRQQPSEPHKSSLGLTRRLAQQLVKSLFTR